MYFLNSTQYQPTSPNKAITKGPPTAARTRPSLPSGRDGPAMTNRPLTRILTSGKIHLCRKGGEVEREREHSMLHVQPAKASSGRVNGP